MKRGLQSLGLLALSIYAFWFAFYGDIPVDNQIGMFLLGCMTLPLFIMSLFTTDEKRKG
jgi:hypothetical protein